MGSFGTGRQQGSPVISLNFGPGRLTRPHNPAQPPQPSRLNPSALNVPQQQR